MGKARYAFLRDFCGVTPRFEPRWQYKAGDITLVGCDYDAMLTPPFGNSAEQIEATSWFRQNYASTGPLTGARVHVGKGCLPRVSRSSYYPHDEKQHVEQYLVFFRS